MEIKFDAETAQSIASVAIFNSLTEDDRNSIVRQAIQYLITPEKSRTGFGSYGETPLQTAFNTAIREAAFKVVKEKITEDPAVTAAINEMLGPLLTAALDAEGKIHRSFLADALGPALAAWLSNEARRGE